MKRKSPDDGFSYRKTTTALDLSGHDLSALGEEKASTSHVHRFFQNHQTKEVEILDLSRCRLGSQGVSCLVSFLSGSSTTLPCLKRIRLNLNAIGADGGRTIGRLISNNNHNLECIDISLNDIKAGGGEPTAVSIISEALETNTILEELIMDKCAIAPEGATCLAKALVKNESLKVLQLAGNMIGPVGADRLFRALRSNSSLEEIGLKMNRIGGCLDKADVRSLSDALGNDGCCCIAKLDLSYNDLNCTGCVVLSEVMKECSLRDLNLEKNDICSEGAVALANAVAKNLTLRNLVLRGNQIGESGAKALGEMLKQNSALKILDLSSCSIGNDGGSALGIGLSQNATLEHLLIDDNSLGSGKNDAFFSVGLSTNKVLNSLHLSSNGLSDGRAESVWGKAIADALSKNTSLRHVDLSNNELSESSIVDAVASHPTIVYFNLSGNDIESITIDSQLILADRMRTMEMDLSLNPLSSPPLGRLANSPNLQNYLTLLANEKTAITRIRLMVLGFGGVGKSTFARAITYEDDPSDFQSTLIPVQEWGVERLKDWAGRLGTAWAKDAVRLVADEGISGKDLTKYVDRSIDNGSNHSPSELLFDLCSSRYQSIEANSFARAIFSLCAKGYLSTVGAVKVEGTITLGERTCSLVDFAGQTEFLTSHQLLLSSLHTLCLIIQSAPSFGIPDHHHYGSWEYWTKFLSSLGDRRRGSLLLAVSQLDRVQSENDNAGLASFFSRDFDRIKGDSLGAISGSNPLKLDYGQKMMMCTTSVVKKALCKSADELANSWWVPLSYEALSEIVQTMATKKKSRHALPIITTEELTEEINVFDQSHHSGLLSKIKTDPQLLKKAMNYLEAVGDVMQAGDKLLIDPIGWFSEFLSHFIKDDLAVSTIQIDQSTLQEQRGTVHLNDIVRALEHQYQHPEEHISQVMALLCGLELCVPLKATQNTSYLFPCLLPSLSTRSELLESGLNVSPHTFAVRGYRFQESSGFLPPGLFLGLLARMFQRLQIGIMHPARTWKDHAVLVLSNNVTRVLLKCRLEDAIIDIIAFAPIPEQLFVGAAKGQASIASWMVHLIKIFLRSYTQLRFDELLLCSNPQCHDGSVYHGSVFQVSPLNASRKTKAHDCNVEGCWRFLGSGHRLDTMHLHASGSNVCKTCGSNPTSL